MLDHYGYSVFKKIIVKDIGDRWYTNQKQTNRNKVDKISNIENIIGIRKKKEEWCYDCMFQINREHLKWVLPTGI